MCIVLEEWNDCYCSCDGPGPFDNSQLSTRESIDVKVTGLLGRRRSGLNRANRAKLDGSLRSSTWKVNKTVEQWLWLKVTQGDRPHRTLQKVGVATHRQPVRKLGRWQVRWPSRPWRRGNRNQFCGNEQFGSYVLPLLSHYSTIITSLS